MRLKKIKILSLSLALMLGACATVNQDQALQAIAQSKYKDVFFVYVDAPNNAISSSLMAASLKITSSTTSDALTQMLRVSDKKPAAVAGRSDMVTAATIRRAIEDTGAAVPRNGKLLIIGNSQDFTEVSQFAKSKGLVVDFVSPEGVNVKPSSFEITPSTDPGVKLQESIQKSNDAQMKQLRRGMK